MQYNDAESTLKAAEEVFDEDVIAIVGTQEYDEDEVTVEDVPAEAAAQGPAPAVKAYRDYTVQLKRPKHPFMETAINKKTVNALNKVVKKAEVEGLRWLIYPEVIELTTEPEG